MRELEERTSRQLRALGAGMAGGVMVAALAVVALAFVVPRSDPARGVLAVGAGMGFVRLALPMLSTTSVRRERLECAETAVGGAAWLVVLLGLGAQFPFSSAVVMLIVIVVGFVGLRKWVDP